MGRFQISELTFRKGVKDFPTWCGSNRVGERNGTAEHLKHDPVQSIEPG
jgi:hypothetical protein